MKNEDNWMMRYEELRAYVAVYRHFPDKHTTLCNWVKYQRKRLKAGQMPDEQKELFLALANSRSCEHVGGRGKKADPSSGIRDLSEL